MIAISDHILNFEFVEILEIVESSKRGSFLLWCGVWRVCYHFGRYLERLPKLVLWDWEGKTIPKIARDEETNFFPFATSTGTILFHPEIALEKLIWFWVSLRRVVEMGKSAIGRLFENFLISMLMQRACEEQYNK